MLKNLCRYISSLLVLICAEKKINNDYNKKILKGEMNEKRINISNNKCL